MAELARHGELVEVSSASIRNALPTTTPSARAMMSPPGSNPSRSVTIAATWPEMWAADPALGERALEQQERVVLVLGRRRGLDASGRHGTWGPMQMVDAEDATSPPACTPQPSASMRRLHAGRRSPARRSPTRPPARAPPTRPQPSTHAPTRASGWTSVTGRCRRSKAADDAIAVEDPMQSADQVEPLAPASATRSARSTSPRRRCRGAARVHHRDHGVEIGLAQRAAVTSPARSEVTTAPANRDTALPPSGPVATSEPRNRGSARRRSRSDRAGRPHVVETRGPSKSTIAAPIGSIRAG